MSMPEPSVWTDRFGRTHVEKSANVPDHDGDIPRVPGVPTDVEELLDEVALGNLAVADLPPNPLVSGCGQEGMRDYTWLVEAPEASAVLLWVNGIFNHGELEHSEFERVAGDSLWALTLRLPASWLASYRIAVWEGEGLAPWRAATDRFAVRTAAMQLSSLDPRGGAVIGGSHGPSSLAAGPEAPAENWHVEVAAELASGTVHEHTFAATERYGEQRVWVYQPGTIAAPGTADGAEQGTDGAEPSVDGAAQGAPTPLLILFDGQVWNKALGLPAILDAAIAGGVLPPLHVAMVDSVDMQIRWAELGVPSGQVDFVLDELLDFVREHYPVSPARDATVVSGQSFGGLAAVWALALGGDRIGHAIAQSPSLWRFDMADVLREQPDWLSLHLQAGRFEGHMLTDAEALLDSLLEGSEGDAPAIDSARPTGPSSRRVTLEPMDGGHDWAWWRPGLLNKLAELLGE
ncbi:MAG: alpha/beta hydrolase-fold protein [Ancrocorticia sp.]